MHRIRRQCDAEPVAHALSLLPAGIARRVAHVRFFCGVDPLYAGLHDWESSAAPYTRSYRVTPHVVWPMHLTSRPKDERVSTVVLPDPDEPWVVIHELGHVLDEAIGFGRHRPQGVTEYAESNTWQAFAEAFTAWLCPDVYAAAQDALLRDEETLALFEELAR